MNDSNNIFRRITPQEADEQKGYSHRHRPQFHYTYKQGFLGDVTGLFYYQGNYHLFNMFDNWSMERHEHKNWGHTVSSDLIHWKQLPPVLDTLVDSHPGSGCGLVDFNNSSGLRKNHNKTIMIFYTDYTQGICISYSTDGGKSFTRYGKNPIIPMKKYESIKNGKPVSDPLRDPLVVWYKESAIWSMILYENSGYNFYTSKNLLNWAFSSRLEDFYECPDIFEIEVSNEKIYKWVLINGDGKYYVGDFDGYKFIPETRQQILEYGKGYAAQTFKRTINAREIVQLMWLYYPNDSKYLWRSEVSFPCKITLKCDGNSYLLCKNPIEDIDTLCIDQRFRKNFCILPKEDPLIELEGRLYNIIMSLNTQNVQYIEIGVKGEKIKINICSGKIKFMDCTMPITIRENTIKLQILIDTSSVEIFANDGEACISRCFFPSEKEENRYSLNFTGEKLNINMLEINRLESIWLYNEIIEGNYRFVNIW